MNFVELFCPVSQRVQMNLYFLTKYEYCVYPAISKIRNKRRSHSFWWCHLWSLRSYWYNFLLSLSMN